MNNLMEIHPKGLRKEWPSQDMNREVAAGRC